MSEDQIPMGEGAKIILKNTGLELEAHLWDGHTPVPKLLGTSYDASGFVWMVRSAAAFHKIPVEET